MCKPFIVYRPRILANDVWIIAFIYFTFCNTDIIENEIVAEETNSSLSSVVGPVIVLNDDTLSVRPPAPLGLIHESVHWLTREMQLGASRSFGPTSSSLETYQPLGYLRDQSVPSKILEKYAFFSYDSLEFRVTLSNPKNLVGAAVVAASPFQTFDPALSTIAGFITGFDIKNMCMRENSVLMPYGAGLDAVITIPWTFRQPVLNVRQIKTYLDPNPPMIGWPILQVRNITSSFVGGNLSSAILNVYMKIHNPRFYGPQAETFDAQSGLLAAGVGLGVKIVADNYKDVFSVLGKTACEATGACSPETAQFFADTASDVVEKNFSNPGKVMQSFFGDTNSITRFGLGGLRGPQPFSPKTIPCPDESEHSFMSFLSRPQHLVNGASGGSLNFLTNNPVNPQPNTILSTSWFAYFSKLARFWRGTLNLHFVICGHPLVEVEFSSLIRYYNPGDPIVSTTLTDDNFVSTDTCRSVFSGVRTITVPMPFASVREYIPVDLFGDVATDSTYFTTGVSFGLRVVSSMLDTQPVIPYIVFFSAGPDFAFYDPRSPNSFLATDIPVMVPQVKLTPAGNAQAHATNCITSKDPGNLVPLTNLESICAMWCRLYPNDATTNFHFPAVSLQTSSSYYMGNIDNLAYLSNIFQCYKGDIACKFMCLPVEGRETVGLSYSDPITNALTLTNLVDNPLYPFYLNPGNGTFVTSSSKQPVLETCLTYRGTNTLSYTSFSDSTRQFFPNTFPLDEEICTINHNFIFTATVGSTIVPQDVIFRKIAPNYCMYIERLPPLRSLWLYNGYDTPQ